MKFDPPLLTEGGLSGNVYVVTHGRVEPHPTIEGETMVIASVKFDVTDQFDALALKRTKITMGQAMMRAQARQRDSLLDKRSVERD